MATAGILYHRRGYAGSSPVEGPNAIPRDAADCAELLSGLKVYCAHLVGLSLSGAIVYSWLRTLAMPPKRRPPERIPSQMGRSLDIHPLLTYNRRKTRRAPRPVGKRRVAMTDRAEQIRSIYEAFARGDIPAVLAAFDPEIEWNEAEHVTFYPGRAFHGPDEVTSGVFVRISETFGDTFRINVNSLHECGDTVIVEGRYTGTVQSSGRSLDAQVVHVWNLEGERINRFQQYTDTWQFAETTGVKPIGPGSA